MGRKNRARWLGVAIALWFSVTSSILAGTIDLRWDSVPEATGYRIYYGTESGVYTGSVTVGNSTEATLQVPAECTTWYVAVKAYNRAGESAEFSNEISGWPRPIVHYITPDEAEQCEHATVSIVGANFGPGADLQLTIGPDLIDLEGNPLIKLESSGVVSCSEIEALISVEPAARGARAAEVGWRSLAFEVVNPMSSIWGSGSVDMEVLFNENRWDINQEDAATEGRIDGSDLSWLAYSYGSAEGDGLYNPDADLNGDGMVDGIDLAYLAAGFGLCWSGSAWVPGDCG